MCSTFTCVQGSYSFFEGATEYKQLTWLTLPALLCAHLAFVGVVVYRYSDTCTPLMYAFPQHIRRATQSRHQHSVLAFVHIKVLAASVVLVPCGILLAVLNALTTNVYGSTGCSDALRGLTCAPVLANTPYSYCFVILASLSGLAIAMLSEQLRCNDQEYYGAAMVTCFTTIHRNIQVCATLSYSSPFTLCLSHCRTPSPLQQLD